MLRRFSAEGALTQAFVPQYSKLSQQDPAAAQQFARKLFGIIIIALLLITVVALLAADAVVFVVAGGLAPEDAALAADLLRIVFPYILFISLVALASGVLNSMGKFAIPALTPALLNISLIAAAVGFAGYFTQPITALAWGVLIGGLAQLAFILIALRRAGVCFIPIFARAWSPDIRAVMKNTGKATLGVGVVQINLLINLRIASSLDEGSITWIYLADRIMELPTGIIGATLSVIALPLLSRFVGQDRFTTTMDSALRLCVLLAAPAAIGIALLALPIISTLFQHGQFSADDSRMAALALLYYAPGIIGLVAVRVLAAGFYANGNMMTPVRVSLLSLFVTQSLNLLFIAILDFSHAGLTLSVGLAACFNSVCLAILLRRHRLYRPLAGWFRLSASVLLALAMMSAIILWLNPDDAFWLQATLSARAFALMKIILPAAGVYFLILFALGVRPSHFQTTREGM